MKLINNKVFAISILILFIFIIIFSYYSKYQNKSLNVFNQKKSEYYVIIDAGHGGFDGGAVGIDGTIEKNLNLEISKRLSSLLKLYGYNVIMTRNDDNSIHSEDAKTIRQKKISDIHNREEIINSNQNAIFVSIHQNKYSDPSVYGTQVFYSRNNILSPLLAQNVQDSVVENLQNNNYRKIKQSGTEIYLLYHSQIPSIMVECGFLSNQNDLNNLKKEDYQKEIAESISNGIIKFFKEQDENTWH